MFDAFSAIGKLVTAILGVYVTGRKTQADLDAAYTAWAKLRGESNPSADDRQDVEDQKSRLVEIRKAALAKAKADSERASKAGERAVAKELGDKK